MSRTFAAACALLAASVTCAEPPCGVVTTRAKPARYGRTHYAAAHVRLFDAHAKDVFVFTGPPPALRGAPLGVNLQGVEVRGVPYATAPASGYDNAPALSGYEGRAAKAAAPSLTSLRGSCALCHTAPRGRGDFVLFGVDGNIVSGVDWRKVRDAVAPERGRPSMPPTGASNPPPSRHDVEQILRLARGE